MVPRDEQYKFLKTLFSNKTLLVSWTKSVRFNKEGNWFSGIVHGFVSFPVTLLSENSRYLVAKALRTDDE